MVDLSVYLVTDNPSRYHGNWLDNIRAAVEGGVTCVQYRDTESDAKTQYVRLHALRDAIGKTPIVVNNSPELAWSINAEGVHVGQDDLPPAAVRSLVGPRCEIGLSITSPRQVSTIDRSLVSYIGIGPVFDARKTKKDAAEAMGLSGLRTIVDLAGDLPNCAIGGLTLENAPSVLASGAGGLAVVSAFSQSENPYVVAKSFRLLFDRCGK